MELPTLDQLKTSWNLNPLKKANSERDELLLKIQQKINGERAGTKFKPISFIVMKMKCMHLDNWDLKMFYGDCERSGAFGRCFFGRLKVKK